MPHPSNWLGSHRSDPEAMTYARAEQLCDSRGRLNDGLAYHCSLTDQVRLWTRKSGCWRTMMLVRDGAVPVCYDPLRHELVAWLGDGWKPIPKD